MKEYRVKVTEKHSDYVWVRANSSEEAKELAPASAECEFECLYDCEVVEEKILPTYRDSERNNHFGPFSEDDDISNLMGG